MSQNCENNVPAKTNKSNEVRLKKHLFIVFFLFLNCVWILKANILPIQPLLYRMPQLPILDINSIIKMTMK